ncbi:MAG TPA: hypothetical protein VNX86_04685 [Rhizomicrobium sp.]|nr:hypothetical protein [Rhizomicrobium sp.]
MNRRKTIAAGIARATRVFGGGAFRDVLVLAGAASIAYGTWMYAHPLGFIVGGALVIAGAVAQEFAGTSDT